MTTKPAIRSESGKFVKGVSGNPSGRPKGSWGLASYIQECTNNGEEVVDFVLGVLRGEKVNGHRPNAKLRMDAATWLMDRGLGKPLLSVDVTTHDENPLDDASVDDLTAMLVQLQEQRALLEANVIEGKARAID